MDGNTFVRRLKKGPAYSRYASIPVVGLGYFEAEIIPSLE